MACKDADPAEIGRNVLSGLRAFVDGGEMPDWNSYRSPLLAAAGVSSWSDLESGSRECVIALEKDKYLLRSENGPQSLLLSSTPEEIGAGVLIALGRSANWETNG